MTKKTLYLIALLYHSFFSYAQDYNWWNKLHNWDGITHWTRYLIIAPGYLGPNALPVPEIKNGICRSSIQFKTAGEYHYSKGDKTQDIYTEFYFPLFSDRVGINLNIVPVEHYNMDDETRDLRRSRDFDGIGYSAGDLYIGTYIQLVKENKRLPDILLTINLRTASGSNLYAARYTDTPGYYFDASIGKELFLKDIALKSIRPFGLIGFYVWQTYRSDYYQNDAFLYGLGLDLNFKHLQITNSYGGYRGYIGNGDRPKVYRVSIHTKFQSLSNYELRVQQGIHDFNYTTFRLAYVLILNGKR